MKYSEVTNVSDGEEDNSTQHDDGGDIGVNEETDVSDTPPSPHHAAITPPSPPHAAITPPSPPHAAITPPSPTHATCISSGNTPFCYTPVTLAPVPDIHQATFLSDTDSTVSTVPEIMCRICRCEPGSEKIISPCYCAGSLQHVHESCLLKWLKAYDCVNKHHCELCQYEFKLKAKPWTEWRIPALSQTEKRRVSCLGIVCFLAILIVLWSINDLVRNSLHLNRIYTDWGFWTKLLFIVFGLFILTFQYPTFKYFYLKLRESNQIVLWGEEGDEQELLGSGKVMRKCESK